jgi:uncharacterized membrane protein
MEHVFFARFPRQEDARKVLAEVAGLDPKVKVDVVGNDTLVSSHDMPRGVNNVPAAAMKGLFGGGLGGLVFGIVLGLTGIGPSLPMTAGFAALFGAIAGTLGAVLIGAQDPDQNLERMAEKMAPGEVILSIHAPDLKLEEQILECVHRSGGQVVPRAGVKPIDDMAINADKATPD